MKTTFKELDSESEDKDTAMSFPSPRSMFRVDEFVSEIKNAFYNAGFKQLFSQLSQRGGIPQDWKAWSDQGVDCEILQPGTKGWKKGKLRIKFTLEFCPDEPDIAETTARDQLVDNIRRMID